MSSRFPEIKGTSPNNTLSKKEGQRDIGSVATLSQRECKAFISQINGLLREATEDPPKGVATGEIERRIGMLNTALAQVQDRLREIQREKEIEANERYIKNVENRLQLQKEADEKRVYNEKERRQQVKEMRDDRVYYFKDRNQRTDEKAAQCMEFNEEQQMQTIIKAGANEDRRKRNIERVAEDRKKKTKELHDREAARQHYADQVNERRMKEIESERRRMEEESRIRDQEIERQLAAVREQRRSKWVSKKKASRARSKVVWENGNAILETEAKDHERLVEELEEKTKLQQRRYAEEQADRQYLLDVRAQQRKAAEERQQRNLLKILDERIKRGDEVLESTNTKKEKGELAKERQANRYVENGKTLRQEVYAHQKSANSYEEQRQNNTLRKNYSRWNTRAARVLADLREAMEADEEYVMEQERKNREPSRNTYSDARVEDSSSMYSHSRVARLPSPSEFTY